jgi:hypothetical protein
VINNSQISDPLCPGPNHYIFVTIFEKSCIRKKNRNFEMRATFLPLGVKFEVEWLTFVLYNGGGGALGLNLTINTC